MYFQVRSKYDEICSAKISEKRAADEKGYPEPLKMYFSVDKRRAEESLKDMTSKFIIRRMEPLSVLNDKHFTEFYTGKLYSFQSNLTLSIIRHVPSSPPLLVCETLSFKVVWLLNVFLHIL